ncbi:MAG: hypothetical protein ABWZ80_04980 [Beijerinckiaceae bacterium]
MLKAVDTARDQMVDSASKIGNLAMEEAAKVKTAVTDGAADVADKAVSAAKTQAGEFQNMLTKEINERPLRALAVAAAIGFLYGWSRK